MFGPDVRTKLRRLVREVDPFAMALAVGSFALPGAFAASHALASPEIDRDRAVLRVLGGAATGELRALDAIFARPFLLLPFGEPATRAAWAAATATAAFGFASYRIGIHLGHRLDGERTEGSPRLLAFVAFLASLLASFATITQLEGSVCGGATLGALLALAPIWVWLETAPGPARALRTALTLGLAATYEPLVGAFAFALLVPSLASRTSAVALRSPRTLFAIALGLGAAALPPLAAFARRRASPELVLPGGLLAHPVSESYQLGTRVPWTTALRELGLVAPVLAAVGVVATLHRERRLGVGLALATLIGFGAIRAGATAEPTHAAAVVVAAVGSAALLAGAGTYELLRRVVGARIPFARFSAALLALLFAAIAARSADDASLAVDARAKAPTTAWERVFAAHFGAGSVVLVPRRDAYEHVLGARARGLLAHDVHVVPTFDTAGPAAIAALRVEPKLAGVLRDVALDGVPGEYALSELAAVRDVFLFYDPSFSRTVARHCVASGLGLRFSVEPRGASDRRAARESGAGDLASLSESLATFSDLRATTVGLLRLRAIAAAAADDREELAWTLADVRKLSPKDDLATRVAPPKPKVEPTALKANARR